MSYDFHDQFNDDYHEQVSKRVDLAVENQALRTLVESLEEAKAEQQARIATLESQVEQARTALEPVVLTRNLIRGSHLSGQVEIRLTMAEYHAIHTALQALREGGEG